MKKKHAAKPSKTRAYNAAMSAKVFGQWFEATIKQYKRSNGKCGRSDAGERWNAHYCSETPAAGR